jgi:magnesium chelatase subunit I
VPRHNRGIVAINELPDLAERIQVAMLNVLEERDVQVRGYSLRLPLDLLVLASANPEDYTNRGRIVTPLKDRFGSEVRTHYPRTPGEELAVMRAEAEVATLPRTVEVPAFLAEVLAAFTRALRSASEVDQRSGVSVRFSVANYETLVGAALRRALRTGEERAVARPVDLAQVLAAGLGKIEFETFEEGREPEILARLLHRSQLEVFRARMVGVDFSGLLASFAEGVVVETDDVMSAADLLGQLDRIPGFAAMLAALEVQSESRELAASALEFVLDGLHLSRRLDREARASGVRYAAV